jgi:hypothetical protein
MTRVTVCIWLMGGPDTFLGTTLGVGHAAIRLRFHNGVERYITWAAQGNPLKAMFKFQGVNRWANVGAGLDYATDKGNMVGFFGSAKPTYKVEIPVLDMTNGHLTVGVSAGEMDRFWTQQLHVNMYAFLSARYNCTGVVCSALRASGLNRYGEDLDSTFVQGASSLLDWARGVKHTLDQMNAARNGVELSMAALLNQHPHTPRTVPTLQAWKTTSNVGISTFARRIEQVAALDGLISEYNTPNLPVAAKAILIARMQAEVASHLTSKPTSDRRTAVAQLGARVTAALQDMAGNID